jgi:hypothetical protein
MERNILAGIEQFNTNMPSNYVGSVVVEEILTLQAVNTNKIAMDFNNGRPAAITIFWKVQLYQNYPNHSTFYKDKVCLNNVAEIVYIIRRENC